jgi:hypothetical protein
MKKMKLAAVIVGAALITGSTISISAASIARDHHKSNSGKGNHGSGYLQGVSHGDRWAALHSILNPQGKDAAPVAPILAPSALLPFDTSTATTLPKGDDGISEDDAAINEDDAGVNDDDASPLIVTPSIPTPLTTPTPSAGIPNPMTAPNGGSHEHADQTSDNSDD